MKICPKCQGALTERNGVYTTPRGVPIPSASWADCQVCGFEDIPKALKKAIKRTARTQQ